MLGIKTGRNKDAPLQKNFVQYNGDSYHLNPGGTFQLSKASVKFKNKNTPGKEEFSIDARNKEQALKSLGQVLKKYDKSIDDLPELKANHIKSYLPPIKKIRGELSRSL